MANDHTTERTVSAQTRERMRQAHLGLRHSAATKAKMSASQKRRGPRSMQTREKMSLAKRGRKRADITGKKHPMAKRVQQLTMDGQLVRTWDCIAEAKEDPKFRTPRYISECCRGLRESYAGYKWAFADPESEPRTPSS